MIRIERQGPVATVQIRPFSDRALKLVKTVSPRHWDPSQQRWEIPARSVDGLVRNLHAANEGVVVDGLVYDPVRAAAEHNRLVPFFDALPEHLHDQAFMALGSVLGPDIGGDADLFGQLCQAVEVTGAVAKDRAKAADKRKAKRVEKIMNASRRRVPT